MRLAWQILRKDAERLWLPVLLTWALLAFWTFHEANPAPFVWPGTPQNAWLNAVLPFAWSLLIALTIQQDSLVGDRQFWVTLPGGWRPLMLAKIAFVAASIQLPYLLATSTILFARGFNPAAHIPHLLWKQLVLLAFIVPAVAAISVVRNVTQFMLLLITVASGLVLFSPDLNQGLLRDNWWDVRWVSALGLLNIGALLTVCLQFVCRYTTRSRILGAATALAAFSVYSWMPRDVSAAIGAALSPASGRVTVQLASREMDEHRQRTLYNFQRTTVAIPLTFSGLPADAELDQISLQFNRDGEVYAAQWYGFSAGVRWNKIEASLSDSWQIVSLYAPSEWSRLRSGPVTVRGRILARLYKVGSGTVVPSGQQKEIGGSIHCSNIFSSAALLEARTSSTIECESAETSPRNLLSWFNGARQRSTGSLRPHGFYIEGSYPEDPWLSPLYRGRNSLAGFIAPVAWTVAPRTPLGSIIIDYTMPDLDLNRFLVHEPARTEAPK